MSKRNRLFGIRNRCSKQPKAARRRHVSLHIEQLEQRMLMDGAGLMAEAGFVNTNPPEDPDSIVGVAGIVAEDDHRETRRGTIQLRIDPLRNDALPEGSGSFRIKSVSATKLGHEVTISDDGQRLIYNAGEDGLQAGDTFYYIVETDDGKLGKANVNLSLEKPIPRIRGGWGGGGGSQVRTFNDRFSFFEDTSEQRLNVLGNDREFRDGEIISVSHVQSSYSYYGTHQESSLNGTIRIAEGGKALLFQPANGFTGTENFTYTVRNENGDEAIASVRIYINKPVDVIYGFQARNRLDFGTENTTSEILFWQEGPTSVEPFIEEINAPDHTGKFSVTPDGKRLVYEPDPNFIGSFNVSYTVRYGPEDYQFVTGNLYYRVQNSFLAVDNWFAVEPESNGTKLDVLENDPIWHPRHRNYRGDKPYVELKIASISTGDQGGQLRVADDGKSVFYQPAEGFTGNETFTYEVLASNGARDSATVTVHVADSIADPSGVDRFANEAELQQFLIDKAVARYAQQFGVYQERYAPLPVGVYDNYSIITNFASDSDQTQFLGTNADYSETNTQVAGIDEADIVETDGHYVYTFTSGTLVIVDVSDPTTPRPVSFTDFEGRFDLMYLQGERMTLLRNGSQWGGDAEILVLDISDRTAPTVVERTEIDGYISDSRAIGDRVHLVVKRSFLVPELGGEWLVEPIPPTETDSATKQPSLSSDVIIDAWYSPIDRGEPGVWRNETLDQYVDRVRESLIETGLPSFRSFDATGEIVDSGLLTDATKVHKPVAGSDLLVSLLTIDAGDDAAGPLAAATSFVADSNTEVYVSGESAYVFAFDRQAGQSTVYKLAFEDDGSTPIVASGVVGGRLLNQFSADEYEGYLRVATTEVRSTTIETSWGRQRVQQQRFNNVVVLEQQGNQLAMVGEVTNLAPTETIHSVRFMGDRAYVVTFRVVDPLFALDMSDPTSPTVEGALKIPGFSNYLHPVGNDFLIGIGRDANEITGRVGPLQITLFNVSDLSNPHVADQVTFEGAQWANSEAWIDHLAVSFFAESGVLAIPITWSEPIEPDGEEVGLFGRAQTKNRSAIWTFKVDTENSEGASIVATGSVEHEASSYRQSRFPQPNVWRPGNLVVTGAWWGGGTYDPGSPARRALRVGESLITVSNNYIKINDLMDPSVQLGEIYLGQLTQDDSFTIDEDSGTNVLDVRANDLADPSGEPPQIVGVSQPTQGGVVVLSDDGETVLFTPEEDFFGTATFTYTALDALRGEETVTVNVMVENVPDDPTAVDDTYSVDMDSTSTVLNVLENDLNPDFSTTPILIGYPYLISCDCAGSIDTLLPRHTIPIQGLRITDLGEPDQQGVVELDAWGQLTYTPAEGFEGIETFSYMITNAAGLTAVGVVSVQVGTPAEPEPAEAFRLAPNTFFSANFGKARPSEREEFLLQERQELPQVPEGRLTDLAQFSRQETQIADRAFSSVGSTVAQSVPFALDDVLLDELVRDQLGSEKLQVGA